MTVLQPTLSSEVKYLEDAVRDMKTAQPFYDGQLTIGYYATTLAAYDFSFVTNYDFSQFDIYTTYLSISEQAYPIVETYLKIMRADLTALGIQNAQYLIHQNATTETTFANTVSFEINVATRGLPIGTTVRVKQSLLSSSRLRILAMSSGLRP